MSVPTKLGRWCLQASEHYKTKCKPEVKQLFNMYDHGFETMSPKYFKPLPPSEPKKPKKEEMTRDPITMLFCFF